jgi:uncharacterized protein YkwD
MLRSLSAVALAFVVFGCSSSDDDDGSSGGEVDCSTATGDAAKECQIVQLVNQTRAAGASCGGSAKPAVPALKTNSILAGTARAHAVDMATNDYFDHTNQQGKSPFDRMKAAGYDFATAGENIAAGKETAEGTMQDWMQSPGHCENIMKADFTEIGVGYAFDQNNQYEHIWVQNFGAPL